MSKSAAFQILNKREKGKATISLFMGSNSTERMIQSDFSKIANFEVFGSAGQKKKKRERERDSFSSL